MTAAAGIHIATGGEAAGSGSMPGAAQGLNGGVGKGASSSLPSRAGTQSFRSSWQSFLASSGIAGVNPEAGTETRPASAVAAQANSRTEASDAAGNSIHRAGTASPEQAQDETTAASNGALPLSFNSQDAALSAKTAAQAANQTVAGLAEKNSIKPATKEAAEETSTERSHKDARRKSAAAGTQQAAATLPAGTAALLPVIPQTMQAVAQWKVGFSPGAGQVAGDGSRPYAMSSQVVGYGKAGAAVAGIVTAQAVNAGALSARGPYPLSEASQAGLSAKGAAGNFLPAATLHGPEQGILQAVKEGAGSTPSLDRHQQALQRGLADIAPSANQARHAMAEENSMAGNERAEGKPGSERARASELHETVAPVAHPAGSQAGAAVPELAKPELSKLDQPNLMLTHEPSAMHGVGNTGMNGTSSGSPPNGTVAASAHDPFVALDGTNGAGSATWIHASAHQAEVGFQDPALGWVGVRAQVDGGGVHAALVPGSADAAQALSSHLAGLNAYLTEHHTPVATLTMAAPGNSWSGQSMDQGAGQGGYSGQQADSNPGAVAVTAVGRSEAAVPRGRSDGTSAGCASGGVYISVMA